MLNSKSLKTILLGILLGSCFILSFSNQSFACPNGCNIFDVSTSALIPNRVGGTAFAEYDFVNQDLNWRGSTSEGEELNVDRYIKTQIITAGLQYNFNRDFGFTLRVPYIENKVKKYDVAGMFHNSDHSLGDIKLVGHYSGFSSDMSSGLIFGVKLPTGNYKSPEFNKRFMQIGTGSTDLIVGGYNVGKLSADGITGYFVQAAWQKPIMISKDFRPGDEQNIVLGANYNFGSVGEFSKVSPLIQLVGTVKGQDRGLNADLLHTGYQRVMFAPGIELETGNFKFYSDVSLPIYIYTEGANQLAASLIFKFVIGYKF